MVKATEMAESNRLVKCALCNNRYLFSPTAYPPTIGGKTFYRIVYGEGMSHQMRRDIRLCQSSKYEDPMPVLCFGLDNLKLMSSMGYTAMLVDERPWVFPMRGYTHFLNKLVAYRYAMSLWDEAIGLDWDCISVKPIPEDIWEKHLTKSELQCPLVGYYSKDGRHNWAYWRSKDQNVVPCACYTYIRGRAPVAELFQTLERLVEVIGDRVLFDEVVMAKRLDEVGPFDPTEYNHRHCPEYITRGKEAPDGEAFTHYINPACAASAYRACRSGNPPEWFKG